MSIQKVAVIGAGTMGAGIAGQAANAGCDVLLLDLPSDGPDVNAAAQKGLDRTLIWAAALCRECSLSQSRAQL